MSDNKQIDEADLGVAGKLTKAFITSPLSIILFFAMLGAGIIGLISTPRQEDPQISVPMIDLFVEYPGASSDEVANIVVKPLERLMSHILGVKHVYSVSDRGQGIITVEFDVGQDMNASIIKVRDKMLANLDFMPPGARQPLIKPKEIDDVPIINLTLWSKSVDDGQLRSLGLELLQQLEKVKDTNNGFVVGGRKEIFHIDAYPGRLAGYGISIQQIAGTVGSANVSEHTGDIELNGYKMEVYSGDFFQKVEDIENLVVAVKDGMPVYVRDVADVYYAPEETEHMVNYYTGKANKTNQKATGEQAVTIAIAKKFGTNGGWAPAWRPWRFSCPASCWCWRSATPGAPWRRVPPWPAPWPASTRRWWGCCWRRSISRCSCRRWPGPATWPWWCWGSWPCGRGGCRCWPWWWRWPPSAW